MEGELVCKYVMKGEESIGESIDVHNDQLIVKVGSEFLGVSVNNIEKVESDKIYVSDFDHEKAENVGKKWVDEKSNPVSMEELKMFGFEEPKEEDEEVKVEGEKEREGNQNPETESITESEIDDGSSGTGEGTETDEGPETEAESKSEEQKK